MRRSPPFRPRCRFAGAAAALAATFAAACATEAPPRTEAASTVDALREAFPDADSLRTREVAPGVRHTFAWDARGPWSIHVVEAATDRCDIEIAARKAGPHLDGRARTSALADGMIAAVNADFFALPAGTPVGAHVENGEPVIGPGSRPVIAVTATAAAFGPAHIDGRLRLPGDTLPIAQVNRVTEDRSAGAFLFSRWYGARTPGDPAFTHLAVRLTDGTAAVGRGVVATVQGAGEPVALDTGVVAFSAADSFAVRLRGADAGDTLTWEVRLRPATGDDAVAAAGARDANHAAVAVGGFPVLLRGGWPAPELTDEGVRPAFGDRRHPRTAVGIRGSDGALLLVTVDGRQDGYSAGMTLTELAWLMGRLGASDALNLDGGGSTAMAVDERIVNRPSDPTGERPVANVLGVVRDADGCAD